MSVTAAATQVGTWVEVSWTDDQPVRDQHQLFRSIDAAPMAVFALVISETPDQFRYVDLFPGAAGQTVAYDVQNAFTSETGTSPTITLTDPTTPYTYGPVDYAAQAPRYTTLARVKTRLNNPPATFDELITESIVAAELAIDKHTGHSFPSLGPNPRWPFVPLDIVAAATNTTVAVLKQTDAPFGTASASELYGELSIEEAVRVEVARSPLVKGYRVRAGMGVSR